MSVPLHNPEKSLGETLQYMSSSITQPTVSLRELLELIGEQGMLVFCMFLTIPFLLPVSIPGVSTVFGLVITLIGIGVAFNRVPWLPARLMNRTIERIHLIPALEKGAALFTRLDKVVSPRIFSAHTWRDHQPPEWFAADPRRNLIDGSFWANSVLEYTSCARYLVFGRRNAAT